MSRRQEKRRRLLFLLLSFIIVVCIGFAVASLFPTVGLYFRQQQQLSEYDGQISQLRAKMESMRSREADLKDPAYTEQKAREEFGLVRKGETSYMVQGAPRSHVDVSTAQVVKPVVPAPWQRFTAWLKGLFR